MGPQQYYRQLGVVLAIEATFAAIGVFIAYNFWDSICNTTVLSCLADSNLSWGSFLLLALFRPFVLTPVPIFSLMAGKAFGPIDGALLSALATTLSSVSVYLLANTIGKKLVYPWLSSNLPQTLKFIRSQDWKIVLASRFIPICPIDLFTFLFGLLDFRLKHVLWCTLLGVIPEAYVFAKIATPDSTVLGSTMVTLSFLCLFCLVPGIAIEYLSRKKGSGLWMRLKAMGQEISEEVRLNNEIVKRHQHDPKKIPVLLLYGFFSSRRALTVLERILSQRGYEVFSFNLGGLFGVFFTRSIPDTAQFIDFKIKRQFERHKFEKIHIVAHSKGGLVALWWLLKLNGHKSCKKLVTMGTPYEGTLLTWLALVTPIGLILRDVWQMRPGSAFLRDLKSAPIPPDLTIYNLYSNVDGVARGDSGVFRHRDKPENIIPVPMHHVTHFEFLYRRDVGDTLASLLGSPYLIEPESTAPATEKKT